VAKCRCGQPLTQAPTGRRRRYCSPACRYRAYRRRHQQSIHFRAGPCEWSTPPAFFDRLDARYHFDLDVCATAANAKCPRFFDRGQDGLKQPWPCRAAWCNPPYGKDVGRWLEKAWGEAQAGRAGVVVCLVFARTDTQWWHTWAPRAEVEFVRGRLRFGEARSGAPHPSALLIFRGAPVRHETTPGRE
jgi:phage N-6-adenine-methyltransferase